jgi:hypothetical protein
VKWHARSFHNLDGSSQEQRTDGGPDINALARHLSDARADLSDALKALSRSRIDNHRVRNAHEKAISLMDAELHRVVRDANANELAGNDAVASALHGVAERLQQALADATGQGNRS